MLKIITSSLCFLLLFNSWVFARDIIAGPIFADVVRVRDGDSVEVVAHVWPGHDVRVSIRLRGIDAPELRARCGPEKIKAIAARARLVQLLGGKTNSITEDFRWEIFRPCFGAGDEFEGR